MIRFRKLLFQFTNIILLINTINFLHAQDSIFTNHFITNAKYAYLYDYNSGQTIYNKNGTEKMVPSSMTKIMTAYIVFTKLKNGSLKLSDKFVVTKNAAHKGGSKMFLAADQRVSIEDLLKGVIILSGNDASIVLAEGINGSEAAFAAKMNDVAKELGMHNTYFLNATGWPDAGHFSTAEDLAILTSAMITNFPEYYYFHSIKDFTFNKMMTLRLLKIIGLRRNI